MTFDAKISSSQFNSSNNNKSDTTYGIFNNSGKISPNVLYSAIPSTSMTTSIISKTPIRR